MNNELLEREEIEEKYKWDISTMFKSIEDWNIEHDRVKDLSEKILDYKGKMIDSSDNLLSTINLMEELYRSVSNLYSFASMNLDTDTRDSKAQALSSKALNLYTSVREKTAFITPELLELSYEKLEEFIDEKEELDLYRHFINDVLRGKEHTLSSREEAMMAQVAEIGGASAKTYSMLNDADIKFPHIKNELGEEVELTQGNFIPFMESKDREVRKRAFKTLYGVYGDYKNTFASTLNGEIKANIFNAKIRNYESSRHASLDDNNIPVEVYDNLINSIHNNLDTMYKYMDIRKKALELDSLHMYDIYTPIVRDADFNFTYEEGVELIKKALEPLGKEYMDIMENGFNSRWVDVYENRGKRSGAYSGGSYDSNPFILLNFKGTLDSVFTTAHEMGHSMHSYLTRENQEYIYGNYSIFLAEIASTTNELLLLHYMLDNAKNDNEKLYLINHFIESFRTTVFRQTMFAEFEMIINKHVEDGGALTADYLCETYKNLNILYYGDNIIVDDEIALEWARIPHFYYNFYVFQYATGFSAAVYFSNKIREEGKEAVDKYLTFLKSGSSKYAIDILKDAGVDMTTTLPVDNGMELFRDLVKEFEIIVK